MKTTLKIMARDFSTSFTITGATLAAAVAAGMTLGTAFDVHLESGAVAWVWEQRA
jgi:hypothetical protein